MPEENESPRHTVTSTDEFDELLDELYPAAPSTPKAIMMAAQEGLAHRQALENDFETYVCELVDRRLEALAEED